MIRNVQDVLVAAALVAAALSGGCRERADEAAVAAASSPLGDALAQVNGHLIHEEDLKLALSRAGVRGEATAEQRRNVVEALVRKELIAQRAEAIGLDDDPRFQARLRAAQAQVDQLRREELGDLFEVKEIVGKAVVSDEQARAWFDAHQGELATEFSVQQILRRDREEIEAVKAELDAGAPFDEVAGRRYEGHAVAGTRPWELGWLRWTQLPEPWRGVVPALEPGATSGVIEGPNGRYWIVKLLERRVRPDVTFEAEKAAIVDLLKRGQVDSRRAEVERELRAGAAIEVAKDMSPPPPPAVAPEEEE